MDDMNENMSYKYQHTYLVYKKILLEKRTPLYIELLAGKDGILQSKIKDIYENQFSNSRVIKVYFYGFIGDAINGDYHIREITYKGYHLIFIVSHSSIIFANYFNVSDSYPQDENCCLVDMHFEHKEFIRSYKIDNSNLKFINTFEPFMDFNRDHYPDVLPSKDINNYFWNDFEKYLYFIPEKGNYDVIMLDSLIIIHGYRKTAIGDSYHKVENHGIFIPLKSIPTISR